MCSYILTTATHNTIRRLTKTHLCLPRCQRRTQVVTAFSNQVCRCTGPPLKCEKNSWGSCRACERKTTVSLGIKHQPYCKVGSVKTFWGSEQSSLCWTVNESRPFRTHRSIFGCSNDEQSFHSFGWFSTWRKLRAARRSRYRFWNTTYQLAFRNDKGDSCPKTESAGSDRKQDGQCRASDPWGPGPALHDSMAFNPSFLLRILVLTRLSLPPRIQSPLGDIQNPKIKVVSDVVDDWVAGEFTKASGSHSQYARMIRAKERRRHQFHQFCAITISTDVGLSEVVMSTHWTFGWKARERLPESACMLREGKHFKDSGLGKVFAETMHTWIGHDLMVRGESPTWHLIIKMLLCSVACDGAWSHSYLIVPTPSLFTSYEIFK